MLNAITNLWVNFSKLRTNFPISSAVKIIKIRVAFYNAGQLDKLFALVGTTANVVGYDFDAISGEVFLDLKIHKTNKRVWMASDEVKSI